ncbi:MAG TPA: hypothetical protein VG756_07755 [Pseudonocardiaceae bacterium]|nr:hypothetical protein [Pseudonocardiaceae bacterium]
MTTIGVVGLMSAVAAGVMLRPTGGTDGVLLVAPPPAKPLPPEPALSEDDVHPASNVPETTSVIIPSPNCLVRVLFDVLLPAAATSLALLALKFACPTLSGSPADPPVLQDAIVRKTIPADL